MSIKEIKKISESPPTYLGGKARYMWQRVVPILNKQLSVNDLDRTLIESL
ncbi:phage terminase small subunit P27 family, partial [Lactococcus lactis subsp. cremoris]|nr:phage terminase small subunit P27 family [Lactococcus cremoris]